MQAARQQAWKAVIQAHSFGTEQLNGSPKVLADVVEAVVGAIFLDTDQDLIATWKVPNTALWHSAAWRHTSQCRGRRLQTIPSASS